MRRRGVTFFDRYTSYESLVAAAVKLETRIFCADKPPALYFLYKAGADKDFRVAFTLYEGAFRRAVRKGSPELFALVRRGFEAIPRSSYDFIDRRWLGAPIATKVNLRIIMIIGLVFLALLVILASLAWILRRRVARATREIKEKLLLLEESEEKNRAFIAALPDLFFTFDRDGRFLDFNAADETELAFPVASFLGKRIEELPFSREATSAFLQGLKATFDTGRIAVFEYDLGVGDGVASFEGRVVPLSGERALLVCRDITERQVQEQRLIKSLEEKDILLKEIHHRVKNNMQVISSLISLQAGAFHDEYDRSLLAETRQRIRSMANIHELLYDSPNLDSVDAREYLRSLTMELSTGYGPGAIALNAEEGIILSLDDAVPFGLIANELVTNALKYAYGTTGGGPISMCAKKNRGHDQPRRRGRREGTARGPRTGKGQLHGLSPHLFPRGPARRRDRIFESAGSPGGAILPFAISPGAIESTIEEGKGAAPPLANNKTGREGLPGP